MDLMNDASMMDDVVVQVKVSGKKGKGGGGGGSVTMNGARGGGKRANKREVRLNKNVSCYNAKHVRKQIANSEKHQQRETKPDKKKN
jgi:hypothetical protein